eukprot:TRINITY_DN795_c0_g1_i1.p1 TRINITY_DN795_c0_g1~~TRINITY_DN795_c0_g1_i1.p1  ORF type:complete len:282 (-),score=47.52 TRINITY_DN795_c0_g1_i1:147-992(-)
MISFPPLSPRGLSRFSNIQQIGKGTYGSVYKALQLNKSPVILKKIPKTCNKRRIRNEIKAGVILRGVPGVPRFHEQFETEDAFWLVFDVAEGTDMLHYMEKNGFSPIPEKEAKDMTKQLARILSMCHTSGVSHKDFKLENIMVDEKGQMSLIDFGLAYIFYNNEEEETCTDFCGSREYAAPEVTWSDDSFSATAADVWSFGITLFCMLYGCFPFSYDAKEYQKIRESGRFPSPHFPSSSKVSEEARNLITMMLDVNPQTRITLDGVMNHPWTKSKQKLIKN